jgi:Winged helix-turn helix
MGELIQFKRKTGKGGRPNRLKPDQLRGVAEIYRAGSRAAGFDTDRWTTERFSEAIFKRFGVHYDPSHAGRIMQQLGLRGRPRLAPLVVHSESLCPCGKPKPPLARACRECSWRDEQIFARLDRATQTGRQMARRAEYLIGNGKKDQFAEEFRERTQQ